MDALSEASSDIYMSAEELLEELNFQKAVLATIDDDVVNKDETIANIKDEIARLKRRLQDLRGGRAPSQLGTSTSSNHQPSSMQLSTASNDDDPFADPISATGSNMPTAFSSTSSTPRSDDSMLMLGHPVKRGFPGDGNASNSNKSRRTSPGLGRRTSSRPSWEDGYTDLTGDSDDESDIARIREQQRRAEAVVKREQDDHEMAMRLHNQISNGISDSGNFGPQAPASSSTRPQMNAYARLMGPPLTQSAAPDHSSDSRQIRNESSIHNSAIRQAKAGLDTPGHNSTGTRINHMPGTFPNDGSSSSDIEAITSDELRYGSNGYLPMQPYSSARYRPANGGVYGNVGQYSRQNGSIFSSYPVRPFPSADYVSRNTDIAEIERERHRAIQYPQAYNYLNPQGYTGAAGRFSQTGCSRYSNGTLANVNIPGGLADGVASSTLPYPGSSSLSWARNPLGHNPLSSILNQTAGIDYSHGLDIYGKPLDPRAAAIFDYVNDPRKTEHEIKDLLENIRPDMDIPKQDREGTPEQLVCALYEHQKLALAWMKSMEEGTNKGGILADDMGLGKTISTLALMVSRPSSDRRRSTTLIVGPVALVRQWQDEILRRIKIEHKLSVFLYHGKKATWDTLRTYDIVLTTYGTLAAEYKRLDKATQDRKMSPMDDREWIEMGKKKFPFLGEASKWYRIILDEAQSIKNKNTQSSLAASSLRSVYRFCLTGTPMMNGVGELYSLIRFLRIKPYNEAKRFNEDFGALNKNDVTRSETRRAMKKLQALLKAILLRRTKTSKIDGEPILKSLPAKEEVVDHVLFSEDEQTYYDSLQAKSLLTFNKYVKAGTVGKNYSNILVLLLRLRQCCCHPHLIMDFEEAPAATDISMEDMDSLAKSLAPEVVGRIKSADGTGFECPVCYDINLNPRFVLPCGHDTCSDCLTKITDQANQEGGDAKCPTCRGKINLKQIIDYVAFKRVHMPEDKPKVEELDDDESDNSNTDSDGDSDEDISDDDLPDLKDFVFPDDVDDDDETQSEDNGESSKKPKLKTKTAAAKKTKKNKVKGKKQKTKRRNVKGKGKAKEIIPHTSLAKLKKDSIRSVEARKKYMRYLRKNWQPSAKVNKCCEIIKDITDTTDEKIIIFSQWTSLLDLLEVPIKRDLEVGYQRYDGSMSAEARDNAAYRFNNSPDCKIMLISLKAGNAGLNLVAASQVIILDPFWNPFIENQAVDRAHRIGQRRIVKVHRILIKETVEDRIIALQDKKRQLVESALDEKASKNLGRLGQRELAYLFGVGGSSASS